MKPSLSNSPAKFILLACVGCLTTSILLLAPGPRDPYDIHRPVAFVLCFGILAAGAVLALKSTTDLRNGVENQQWPQSQIEPFRRHFRSPLYTALSIALLIAFVLSEFFFKRRFRYEGWTYFLFLQTLSQIRIAFKPPRPEPPPPPDWHSFAPLHSDHWGQR